MRITPSTIQYKVTDCSYACNTPNNYILPQIPAFEYTYFIYICISNDNVYDCVRTYTYTQRLNTALKCLIGILNFH